MSGFDECISNLAAFLNFARAGIKQADSLGLLGKRPDPQLCKYVLYLLTDAVQVFDRLETMLQATRKDEREAARVMIFGNLAHGTELLAKILEHLYKDTHKKGTFAPKYKPGGSIASLLFDLAEFTCPQGQKILQSWTGLLKCCDCEIREAVNYLQSWRNICLKLMTEVEKKCKQKSAKTATASEVISE